MSVDPFHEKKLRAERDRIMREGTETLHWRNLFNSECGQWIMRELIDRFENKASVKPTGNSWDMFSRGELNVYSEYRTRIIRYLGAEALGKLMEGIQHGSNDE